MYQDVKTLLSDDQAITVTAASTNYYDAGSAVDLGMADMSLLIQVTNAFATLTSLTIAIQADSAANFGTAVTLASQTIAQANLTAGARFAFQNLPKGAAYRYWRIYYTVAGTTEDEGTITAQFGSSVENWSAIADGI